MSDNLSQNASVQFKPHPPIQDDTLSKFKYYYATQRNFRMIRHDGKAIVFQEHFFETDQSGDIEYLDEEIEKHHNMMLRYATPDETRDAHYRKDPKGVLTKEILSDEGVMAELRAKVREEVMKEQGLNPDGSKISTTDYQRIKDIEANKQKGTEVNAGEAKVTLQPKAPLMPAFKPHGTNEMGGTAHESNSTQTNK